MGGQSRDLEGSGHGDFRPRPELVNGEVHDLEESSSFAHTEDRAEALARRLGVPFTSGI